MRKMWIIALVLISICVLGIWICYAQNLACTQTTSNAGMLKVESDLTTIDDRGGGQTADRSAGKVYIRPGWTSTSPTGQVTKHELTDPIPVNNNFRVHVSTKGKSSSQNPCTVMYSLVCGGKVVGNLSVPSSVCCSSNAQAGYVPSSGGATFSGGTNTEMDCSLTIVWNFGYTSSQCVQNFKVIRRN